ncbi:unnamed protein product [Allacma fusca]|uniref:Uncharacterized protein n=1 Tax=Allacma fusca TaxID=39272 RepID=A0A8J2L5B7_9HEXA|nr:unnamed protein product [Allacma fusca]
MISRKYDDSAHIKKRSIGRHSIHLRRQELDDKLVEMFGSPNLDERYEENVRHEKEATLKRVKDLTNRNSQLLRKSDIPLLA